LLDSTFKDFKEPFLLLNEHRAKKNNHALIELLDPPKKDLLTRQLLTVWKIWVT
jgi:hypothetical protein